ncbi:adenosylcobinamide-GDP ribazoletransferase [Halopelagius longus]|uniref:Adenosylcobinamide-GDP ribazoletransferase n=1 Tax=Halopelagius longus TaxID=1236180 RepID=A0A370IQP0_9EURY|nr:adenosylcobinamide-GDP ribazoletransferase [Halopelagius longus]RDI73033.1 adenosylcobinamide-GDP ribazoletransferase [Halopelagius longus]
MTLTAVRGGLTFLTRLPVESDEESWEAFRRTPAAFPLVGYVVGLLAALVLSLSLPAPTAVALYLLVLYLLTGVTHADGLADVGDAAAVHGEAERRTAVLKDSATGVGGALSLGVVLLVLALGALSLADASRWAYPAAVFAIALAAEVGAKTGMAYLVCTGSPAHEGMGSALAGEADAADFRSALVPLIPLALVAAFAGGAGVVAAALAPVGAAHLVGRWAEDRLGGVSGDVFGAANELGRAVGLHAGVIAWTLF